MNTHAIIHALPHSAIELAHAFVRAGYRIYLVGGSMRDILLGKIPNDFDFATNARPHEICELLKDYELIKIGEKFGTIGVIFESIKAEITTFRKDGVYSDNRHPGSIVFADNIEQDLQRRDFSINAIACDMENLTIIDTHNGMRDLKHKIVRAIGNPSERFNEDGLRILRAFSLCARFDFDLHDETLRAIISQKKLLENISKERVCNEILKILHARYPRKALSLIKKHEILELEFPKHIDMISERYRAFTTRTKYIHPKNAKKAHVVREIIHTLDSHKGNKKILLNMLTKQHGLQNLHIALQCTRRKKRIAKYFHSKKIQNMLELKIDGNDIMRAHFAPTKINAIKDILREEILYYRLRNERGALLRKIRALKNPNAALKNATRFRISAKIKC